MPDYKPLSTTPQAILPRFPEAPEFADRAWVLNAIANSIQNNNSTNGNGNLYGNYSGTAPIVSGTNGQFATDSSTSKIWVYVNGAWVFTGVTA